jgi:hypothetical protein
MEIFCDEAGFTGNNLLDHNQPFFAYASVAISPCDARAIVDEARKIGNVQMRELKSEALLKRPMRARAKRAITFILKSLDDRFSVLCSDKDYALASKFFEYIFEPVLAANSSIFYSSNFHRFIANLLYVAFKAQSSSAYQIMRNFQAFVEQKKEPNLNHFLPHPLPGHRGGADPLAPIAAFARAHHRLIATELNRLRGHDWMGAWLLDLTETSLYRLLCNWGERFESLEVYCDEALPLKDSGQFFQVMIGRKDKQHVNLGGRTIPLTFNLKKPIELVKSVDHPGVQLADVVAGVAAFILRNPGDSDSEKWQTLYNGRIAPDSMFPDSSHVDLNRKEPCINGAVLFELAQRAKKGTDPLGGMAAFYSAAEATYSSYVRLQMKRTHSGTESEN